MKDPNLSKWVSAAVTPQDKEMLRRIAHIYGSPGESATVRRLIREEALRRGIVVELPPTAQPASQEG